MKSFVQVPNEMAMKDEMNSSSYVVMNVQVTFSVWLVTSNRYHLRGSVTRTTRGCLYQMNSMSGIFLMDTQSV